MDFHIKLETEMHEKCTDLSVHAETRLNCSLRSEASNPQQLETLISWKVIEVIGLKNEELMAPLKGLSKETFTWIHLDSPGPLLMAGITENLNFEVFYYRRL